MTSNTNEPNNKNETEFSSKWQHGFVATIATMIGIVIFLLFFNDLPIFLIKQGIHHSTTILTWTKQHEQLTSALAELLVYSTTFATLIYLLKLLVAPGSKLFALVRIDFRDARQNFGKLFTTTINAYFPFIVALIVTSFLPLPEPGSPAGEFAKTLSGWSFAVFAITACILAPLCEEIVFRGFVYNMLSASLSRGRFAKMPAIISSILAVSISGALFAGIHFTLTGFLTLFIMGMALAAVYKKTNNLCGSMMLHCFNNVMVTIMTFLALQH